MKRYFILFLVMIMSLNLAEAQKKKANVLLKEFNTPYGVPPFSEIKVEDYKPAILEAIKEHTKEINAIVVKRSTPTFKSILEEFDNSGEFLDRVTSVFYNMNSSSTTKEIQELAREISPLLTKHSDDIMLNKELFQRIKHVYDNQDKENLNDEQKRLLEITYKDFVRSGANLSDKDQARLREINGELALLTLHFGQNVLSENNKFKLVIDNESDLAGLPQGVIEAAAEAAKESGNAGKWVFTLHNPSWTPFMTYADNRELRKEMFYAYSTRGNHGDEFDNNENIKKIVNLRLEKAKLFGFTNYADYSLQTAMAKNSEKVNHLLREIWGYAEMRAEMEANDLQMRMTRDIDTIEVQLEPWDWRYYTEKIRKENFDFNEEEASEFFQLEKVQDGAFQLATVLYGLMFIERDNIPTYNPEVKVYEVKDMKDNHVGILYMDFFPRASKRGGAWMSSFRKQHKINGKNITPIITTVFNFTKPTANLPALLTLDEVETLFHEFGHALHGLLSNCQYKSLSGTSVPRDFVELPSQIMENWAFEPLQLEKYAFHYTKGEPMTHEMMEKIEKISKFNQGFATSEYLAAAMLDMQYHTITAPFDKNPMEFEDEFLGSINLKKEIISRYRSTYFNHIFSGGYSAGYYSYIWAEVLDADAFELFKQKGIFDYNTAQSFKENILERGNTIDPAQQFINFRGREPMVDPLIEKRGLR